LPPPGILLLFRLTAPEWKSWEARVVHREELRNRGGSTVTVAFKPESYSTVSPYLVVDGASRTIDFLGRVFGAVELRRFDGPDGKIVHAEVRIDDSVVMLADGTEGWPPIPAHVHVYVRDVDETFRLALEAGATSVQEPVKKDDEDKRGGIREPGGVTWWIATRVERLVG
jgi:PhnB protein